MRNCAHTPKKVPQNRIDEKITWGVSNHARFRSQLLKDCRVSDLLTQLNAAIRKSRKKMQEIGIFSICKACDQKEGGSCCGAGLEDKYDQWLILINLLFNVDLPLNRIDAKSCFFLGPGGCRLKARHVICINYLCKKISDPIDGQHLSELRDLEGTELELLFHLKERVKKILIP